MGSHHCAHGSTSSVQKSQSMHSECKQWLVSWLGEHQCSHDSHAALPLPRSRYMMVSPLPASHDKNELRSIDIASVRHANDTKASKARRLCIRSPAHVALGKRRPWQRRPSSMLCKSCSTFFGGRRLHVSVIARTCIYESFDGEDLRWGRKGGWGAVSLLWLPV